MLNEMKYRIFSFILFFFVQYAVFNVLPFWQEQAGRCSMANAQTRLWVRGSAVPGGVQELTRFSTSTTGRYTFKFHGTLLPGDLYITTTETPKTTTRYYAPKLVDTNIVTDKMDYTSKTDSIGSEWAVLFEADNYRFTVDVYNKQVTGELFTWWYEAWICGGCVEDEQGKGSEPGHWQITAGKAMEQSWNDRNVWEWTGLLKNYTYNDEPRRFKINGQYGWSPKVLHPFTQDASILTAKQIWYNGSEDYKWRIVNDGYYRIVINVFEETITGEYLGTEAPDGIIEVPEAEADISVSGYRISLQAPCVMTVRLFSADGSQRIATSGTDVSLTVPASGIYILFATDGQKSITRKIIVE